MKKILKSVVVFVMTLVLFGSHEPTFGTGPDHPDQQHGSIATNEPASFHFSVKSWAKYSAIGLEMGSGGSASVWGIGSEGAIGPFIEWRPVDWFGIQTGLVYSGNTLCEHFCIAGDTDAVLSNRIEFRAFSLPLYFRFYPGQERQFVFYGGGRAMSAHGVRKAHNSNFAKMFIDVEDWKNGFKRNPDGSESRLVKISDREPYLILDFGFEYNFKNGFILGMNGLGLTLGYDFMS